MRHLLLPDQIEKGCFRQQFNEYVLVPFELKERKKKQKTPQKNQTVH